MAILSTEKHIINYNCTIGSWNAYINLYQLSGEFSGNANFKRGLEIKHFQLTKYKFFLGKGRCPLQPPPGGQPPGPHIIFLLLAGV